MRTWEKFPGIGYRKLSHYLQKGKSQIQRILQKYRGKKTRQEKEKRKKRRNILKEITKELIEKPQKEKRGNWELVEGRNKYQKIIRPTRPYQLFTGDWKEFRLPGVNIVIYIFIIIDAYTRQLKGYHFSLVKDVRSAIKAAEMAIKESRQDDLYDGRKLIMHQDQGSSYTAEEYEKIWRQEGVKLSYSDPGKPTQNGYSEGFISIFSRFWLKWYKYESVIELEKGLEKFFNLYNEEWKHSGIDYLTPNEKLNEYRNRTSLSQISCLNSGS